MGNKNRQNYESSRNSRFDFSVLIFVIFSVSALLITFLISISSFGFTLKAIIFLAVTIVYLVSAVKFNFFQKKQTEIKLREIEKKYIQSTNEYIFSPDVEEKLLSLEEVHTIFGASLKPPDMFRLVSNRINEIINFTTAVMFLVDDQTEKLTAVYVSGRDSAKFSHMKVNKGSGLAGSVFQKKTTQFDNELKIEKLIIPVELVQNIKSGLACPLLSDGTPYGVLAIYSDIDNNYDAKSVGLLSAIGERISPIFLNSINFERSLDNALNDSLTKLPNERALFFVLENQIAESQRQRGQRPLTLLSFDIQQFTELNKTYGHATGDRILNFAAEKIKKQLRQMDFLARVMADEFLAVLPTSSEKTTEMIVSRIERTFATTPFVINEKDKIFIKLNFGFAEFMVDGETAQDLMNIADIRKHDAKSPIKNTVLWFPKEHIN